MSENNDNAPIIIRRKKTEGEEDHHGGVWKLAFADFMTAMMAFFLVMWLINSTSKETKAVIVQYFNPVQLTDTKPAHKGVSDPTQVGQGKNLKKTEGADSDVKETAGAIDEELHANPIKALDEIAKREITKLVETKETTNPAPLFEDPFDRSARELKPKKTDKSQEEAGSTPDEILTNKTSDSSAAKIPAENLKNRINKILEKEFPDGHGAPLAEVRKSGDDFIVALTDNAKFTMFEVGSITPKPQLVRVLEQIGKALATEPGNIEIRGYTDARVYAAKNYDNWRLSSDRATMVNYMLVRGGLAAQRVERIIGYADRQPKNASDPLSPVNRRIEILLRPVKR